MKLRALFLCAALQAACPFASAASAPLPSEVRVLMYHRIDDSGPASTRVDPAEFVAQMDWLAARKSTRPVVSSDQALEIVRRLSAGEPPDPSAKAILVTVDDGWKSTELFANTLSERGFPGTLFMVSSMAGAACCLSKASLAKLPALGVEVENHTRSHSAKIARASSAAFEADLRSAQTTLGALSGTAPDLFAYPYGLAPAGARAGAARLGFKALFGTAAAPWRRSAQNSMVPRYNVSGPASTSRRLFLEAVDAEEPTPSVRQGALRIARRPPRR